MKIVFLCGSLEFGRDGVGDYVRRLAGELIKQGHQIAAVALNDEYLVEKFIGIQSLEAIELSVLRVPSIWSAKDRFEHAKAWIDKINPDLLSLQFVIFAFHPKGLPFNLSKLLSRLGGSRKWHIMFHELWVGMAINDTFKRNLLGEIQKVLIKTLIKELNPKLIHTQCDLFLGKLNQEGVSAKKLPLFSNIKVYSVNSVEDHILSHPLDNAPAFKFVLFGGLHPESKLHELISALKFFCKSHDRSFEFWYLGRNGEELGEHLKLLNQEKVSYKVYGELDPEYISSLLSISSYGISTGSPQMIEKNGTVAAMLDHNLPVICIGRDLMIKNAFKVETLNGIFSLADIEQLLIKRPAISSLRTLSKVAATFIGDIQTQVVC
jgi:hypothetical protein